MEQEIAFEGSININQRESGGRIYLPKFLMKLMGVKETTPVYIIPKKDEIRIKVKKMGDSRG